MSAWQPIATAPRGVAMLLWEPGMVQARVGSSDVGDEAITWFDHVSGQQLAPTHWQPLPAPPA